MVPHITPVIPYFSVFVIFMRGGESPSCFMIFYGGGGVVFLNILCSVGLKMSVDSKVKEILQEHWPMGLQNFVCAKCVSSEGITWSIV